MGQIKKIKNTHKLRHSTSKIFKRGFSMRKWELSGSSLLDVDSFITCNYSVIFEVGFYR